MKSYRYPAVVRDNSKTKGAIKYVLLALATYADDAGECFPSYAELVKVTGLSLNTVRRAIGAIPADEMVIIEKGRAVGRPSKYRIIINERSTANCAHGEHSSEVNCAHGEHSQNSDCAHGEHTTMPKNDPNYAHGGTLTTKELPIELPKARKRASGSFSDLPSKTADPPIPSALQTPAFLEAWAEWLQYRRQIKKALKPLSQTKQLKEFQSWGPDRAIAAINHSIARSYQGPYEPNGQNGHKPKQGPSLDEYGLPKL
jgi:Helix-turn-helix domain